jgi:LmbE family N-acetylglucosaminyl deacetylase
VNNILLVSAHPDDMEIGMGGTAAKLAESGAMLYSLVLTDGRRGPNPNRLSQDELAAQRKEEAKRAAKILGVHEVIFCELQDLKSENNYKLAVQSIRNQIMQDSVIQIFTLHPQLDRHETHRLAGKAVVDSFLSNEAEIPIWAYEVWGLFPEWERFEDISSTMDKKLDAIGQHQSQTSTIPFGDGVAGLNRWRAVFADPDQKDAKCAFAEVFVRLR